MDRSGGSADHIGIIFVIAQPVSCFKCDQNHILVHCLAHKQVDNDSAALGPADETLKLYDLAVPIRHFVVT